ncbi:MAG TPA: histidine phosphatase family protein [Anaerolineales bacterium]|nr:histidine phosphatase family protein [Anaerolineales bacterium]
MQLYFIRHGQSVNNAGWGDLTTRIIHDPALTEIGAQQTQITANYLEQNQQMTKQGIRNEQNRHGFGITRIYTSLMERAAHTASYMAGTLEVPFETWEQIHESGGIYKRGGEIKSVGLAGRSRAWYEANVPALSLPETLDESGWWNRPFETEEECQSRAQRVWADLLTRHSDKDSQPEEHVAFVSHGGFFVHLMGAILELPWKNASHGLNSWFLLNNCSISRVDVRKGYVTTCYINRTSHLPDNMIT